MDQYLQIVTDDTRPLVDANVIPPDRDKWYLAYEIVNGECIQTPTGMYPTAYDCVRVLYGYDQQIAFGLGFLGITAVIAGMVWAISQREAEYDAEPVYTDE